MTRRSHTQSDAKPRKRLGQLPVDTPLAVAVTMILRQRLDAVLFYLPRVAARAEQNVEFVHQLRVAARRSTAALDAYQSLLPRKRARRLRSELRALRRALGEARDLDVMTLRLAHEAERQDSKKLRRVVRTLKSKRTAEQSSVVNACAAADAVGLSKVIGQIIKRVSWRGDVNGRSLSEFNARLLRDAIERFFLRANTSTHEPLILHEARIEAKRLRYTLELVEPVLPKSAGSRSGTLFAELQESLGRISDHAAAADLFDHWADDSRAGSTLKQLAAVEREQLGQAVADFHAVWTPKRLEKLRQLLVKLAGSIGGGSE